MTAPRPLALFNAAFEKRCSGLRTLGVLGNAELLLVDTVAPRFGDADPDVLLGLALAARAPRAGHVGVNLLRVRERSAHEVPMHARGVSTEAAEVDLDLAWPRPAASWEKRVLDSKLVGERDDKQRPFVRQATSEGWLLMTRRMWREQERFEAALDDLLKAAPCPALSEEAVSVGLRRLFGEGAEANEGAQAVARAARNCLTVVTGGPGTGKTYSITRLLALLLSAERSSGSSPLRIELAAPTGKAAVRMAEAIAEAVSEAAEKNPPAIDLATGERLCALEPRTLHRLLGVRPNGTTRHGPKRPLEADVVVVDEASMVDLALMSRLLEAIPPGARLVLLGDPDQLASVEAGSVLADLVSAAGSAPTASALGQTLARFTHSRRFKTAPTVAAIAAALQKGGPAELVRAEGLLTGKETVSDPMVKPLVHLGPPPEGRPDKDQLASLAAPYFAPATAKVKHPGGYAWVLGRRLRKHGAHSSKLQDPKLWRVLLDALDGYRVLATHRRGPLGVTGLLRALSQAVQTYLLQCLEQRREFKESEPPRRPSARGPQQRNTAKAPKPAPLLPARGPHWLGRPLLITRNSYEVGLMNGDVGLVLPGARGLVAVFPHDTGATKSVRSVALARLPPHTGALAMTVHKSQGSQFRHVALVLADHASPIQTRELVYTGITRSSSRLTWLGSTTVLHQALTRRVQRASGLVDLLVRPDEGEPEGL